MKKLLIVQARFYNEISDMLIDGAVTRIKELGYDHDVIDISGALEIPYTIATADKHKSDKYDGYIALGCVIRGETSHYDIVTSQSAYGIMKLTIENSLAIGNGIITTEDRSQAIRRASKDELNKGAFAVNACHKMILLKEKLLNDN